MRSLVVLVVLAGLLTGCGAEVDEDAWRADIEAEIGSSIDDWPAYRDVWLDVCEEDEQGFDTFIAVGLDEGQSWDYMRTNIRHGCSDRLEELEELRSDLGSVQSACDTPASERTEEEARMAEAMGC